MTEDVFINKVEPRLTALNQGTYSHVTEKALNNKIFAVKLSFFNCYL